MTSVLQRFMGSGPCVHTSSFHGCLKPGRKKTAVKKITLVPHVSVNYIS